MEYPFHTEHQITHKLLQAIYDAQPFTDQERLQFSAEDMGVDAPGLSLVIESRELSNAITLKQGPAEFSCTVEYSYRPNFPVDVSFSIWTKDDYEVRIPSVLRAGQLMRGMLDIIEFDFPATSIRVTTNWHAETPDKKFSNWPAVMQAAAEEGIDLTEYHKLSHTEKNTLAAIISYGGGINFSSCILLEKGYLLDVDSISLEQIDQDEVINNVLLVSFIKN